MNAKTDLYKKLAQYYDLIYSFKNYLDETALLLKVIEQYKKSPGNTLLDVACGTGKHLSYLKDKFQCIGTDLNEKMLNVARKNVPGVRFIQKNMINMRLHMSFDILTCLFSSIAYVKTYENLAKTIETFSLHLNTGGIAIIEPWFTKETFKKVGYPPVMICEDRNTRITRFNTSKIKGNLSVVTVDFSVETENTEVEYIQDQHELAMFEPEKTLHLMKNAGFEAHFLKAPTMGERGLFVGIKIL